MLIIVVDNNIKQLQLTNSNFELYLYYYFVDTYFIYCFTLDIQGQEYQFGATITSSGGTAISKTFQILYRNESIVLNDSFVFRLHMLVNSDKVNIKIPTSLTQDTQYD